MDETSAAIAAAEKMRIAGTITGWSVSSENGTGATASVWGQNSPFPPDVHVGESPGDALAIALRAAVGEKA